MGWSGRSAAPRLSTYFCHLASDSAVSPTSTRNRGSRLLYAPRSRTGPIVVDRPTSRSPRISPPLPSSRFFIHAGEKNGSNRSIFQEGNKKEIGRRGKNETIVSRVCLFVRRCRIYNSDNGLADELLKQTNGGRIEQLARNGIPVFFLSLNAQELTRFPPHSLSLPVSP